MKEVVIIDGVRTPIGNYGGTLAGVRPDDLLAHTLKALTDRVGLDPVLVDDVYAGCGNQAGEDNSDVGRIAALLAGFPISVAGVTINRNCASALEAVNQAAKAIATGEGEVYLGSGVESMSRAPWSVPKPEQAPTMTAPKMWDTTVGWRYHNPQLDAVYPVITLGETAENIAADMRISREEQDKFAFDSHCRAVAAINDGRFKDEITPVPIPRQQDDPIIFDTDEHPRYRMEMGRHALDTSTKKLSMLSPAFRKNGTVTAGNSSGINDGAAALLLMSREKADELGLKPMVRWIASAVAGVDPGVMGYGPIPATEKLLQRLNLKVDDIGLVELHEAFAAQTIGVMRKLGLRHKITNVNGGAIALGHPVGCSGARILVTLIHEMKRRAPEEKRPYYGLATISAGVGMGVSTVVEWLDK